MRLKSSEEGRLNFRLRWKSQLQANSAPGKTNQMLLKGKAPSRSDPNYKNSPDPVQYDGSPGKGMYFAAVLEVHSTDGISNSMTMERCLSRMPPPLSS